MKRPFRRLCLCLLGAATLCGVTSCSSDDNTELSYKLRKKSDAAYERADRRKMRREARQERTNIWFKTLMGT